MEWASEPPTVSRRIFWLHGQAGVGKSTIASSVSHALQKLGWLGASFFFSWDGGIQGSADQLFSSIAFQLANFNSSIAAGILQAIDKDIDVGRSRVLTQFQTLVEKPLIDADNANGLHVPIIIVLDALDECGSERDRTSLLSVICDGFPNLPASVRFFVTSRPEPDLRTALSMIENSVRAYDVGNCQEEVVERDIATYFEVRLKSIAQRHGLSANDGNWPGHQQRATLTRRAGRLFIWASTVCDFIDDDESEGPEAQLYLILGDRSSLLKPAQPWSALDGLYLRVLQEAAQSRLSSAQQISEILGILTVILQPLSISSLGSLLAFPSLLPMPCGDIIRKRLRKLHSVLRVPQTDDGMPRFIHPSLMDFLTIPDRCTDSRFFVDGSTHHRYLAKQCLIRIRECLRQQPFSSREDMPDDLRYACCFWAKHLHESPKDNDLFASVRDFALHDFQQWLEVLAVIDAYQGSYASVRSARDWIKVYKHTGLFIVMLV
jgi:hypothetical protein